MKALVQRVIGKTSIVINGGAPQEFAGPGLVVLLGWDRDDEVHKDLSAAEEWVRSHVSGLRVFPDKAQKMNLSLEAYLDQEKISSGGILWVSQFSLGAELDSGYRPSFTNSMNPLLAAMRYKIFTENVRKAAIPQVTNLFGEFGADMALSFTNWGPLTIPLQR